MYIFLQLWQQYNCLIRKHQTAAYGNTFPPLGIYRMLSSPFFRKVHHLWWTFFMRIDVFSFLRYTSVYRKRKGSIAMTAKKVISIFCIALILFLFVCTLVLAITNSPYFMICLFLSMITPVIIYIFVWLYKLTHPSEEEKTE